LPSFVKVLKKPKLNWNELIHWDTHHRGSLKVNIKPSRKWSYKCGTICSWLLHFFKTAYQLLLQDYLERKITSHRLFAIEDLKAGIMAKVGTQIKDKVNEPTYRNNMKKMAYIVISCICCCLHNKCKETVHQLTVGFSLPKVSLVFVFGRGGSAVQVRVDMVWI
jgi:hypothetical protein